MLLKVWDAIEILSRVLAQRKLSSFSVIACSLSSGYGKLLAVGRELSTLTHTERNAMTISIAQFKKILPALRLIDKPMKVRDSLRQKVLDVWKVSEDRVVFATEDSSRILEVTVNGLESSHFDLRTVNFDKFNKLIGAVKSTPAFDIAEDQGLSLNFDKRVVSLTSAVLQKMVYAPLKLVDTPDSGQQWDTDALSAGLAYCAPAVSTDETRFHLNAILFAENGHFVSTDGHRLHRYDYDAAPADGKRFLLPLSTVKILQAAIKACGGDKAMVYSTRSQTVIRFTVDGGGLSFKLTSKLEESQFPRYDAVIPKSWEHRCNANAAQFGAAAALLAKLSDTISRTVDFKLDGQLKLDGLLRFKGDGVEEMIVASDTEGNGFQFGTIGANGDYLKEAANLPGEMLSVEFGGELEPIAIKQDRYLAVVMPIRI